MARQKGSKNKLKEGIAPFEITHEANILRETHDGGFVTDEMVPIQKPSVPERKAATSYRLIAKFRGVDSDGNRTIFPHESEGSTLEEVLEKLVFPKRIVALIQVSVKVKRGDTERVAERSFAPHKWNYILENKDAKELQRLLGV